MMEFSWWQVIEMGAIGIGLLAFAIRAEMSTRQEHSEQKRLATEILESVRRLESGVALLCDRQRRG